MFKSRCCNKFASIHDYSASAVNSFFFIDGQSPCSSRARKVCKHPHDYSASAVNFFIFYASSKTEVSLGGET